MIKITPELSNYSKLMRIFNSCNSESVNGDVVFSERYTTKIGSEIYIFDENIDTQEIFYDIMPCLILNRDNSQ